MPEFDRVQAKQAARRAMKAQRPHPMLITLLFSVLVSVGSQLINGVLGAASGSSKLSTTFAQAFYQYEEPATALQYTLMAMGPGRIVTALLVGGLVAGILVFLWSGIMQVGYSNFCLQMVRGRQPLTGALFSAFPKWAGVLLTQFLVGLFRDLWILPFAVGEIIVITVATLLFSEVEALMVLIFLVSYIAMFVGIAWVTLRYALVNFLIADKGLTGMDAIRESKRFMKGNTGKLFVLELSFIGWYLLEAAIVLVPGMMLVYAGLNASDLMDPYALIAGGMLALLGLLLVASILIGILNLWLSPYITGAQALFYDWTQGLDINSRPGSSGGGQGGWGQPHNYTWTDRPTSGTGTGIGPGPQDDVPKPPRSPRDDPWN